MTTRNNGTAVVECAGLCLGYRGETVLRDVNIAVPAGALLPFAGPNGGGKTTLLRGILGLLRPLAGRVAIQTSAPCLGYVPQQKTIDPLYPVPVARIVAMGLYPRMGWWGRMGSRERDQVDAALRQVGMAAAADKNFRELSGGMKQRVLIARALVTGADIIVLDEPTSELDLETEREIVRQLYRLSEEMGKTILIACHGVQLALLQAESICLVERGRATLVSNREARRFTFTPAETAAGLAGAPAMLP